MPVAACTQSGLCGAVTAGCRVYLGLRVLECRDPEAVLVEAWAVAWAAVWAVAWVADMAAAVATAAVATVAQVRQHAMWTTYVLMPFQDPLVSRQCLPQPLR